MQDAATRIDELRALVGYHFERYHAEDEPEIPDADYDALVVELRALEADNPPALRKNAWLLGFSSLAIMLSSLACAFFAANLSFFTFPFLPFLFLR